MIFWTTSLVFFIIGLNPKYGYILLFPLITIIPFSNTLAQYFYKFGLNSYDFFFMGVLVYLSVKAIYTRKISASGIEIFILITIILIITSLFFNEVSKYWIRDLRLLLILIFGHITYVTLSSKMPINSSYSLYIFLIAAISCIFWGLMNYLGKLNITDLFYINNAFRYFSVSTYMCAVFLIFSSQFIQAQKQRILYSIVVLLSALAVLISGLRSLTVIVILIFIVTRIKNLSAYIFIPIIFIFLLFISSHYNDNELFSRLLSLDAETISSNTSTRFVPFFKVIAEFSEINYLLGSGLGTTFEIGWFEWRENKDVHNNFIDSTYLTLYAKLGILSLIYIFGFVRSLMINLPNHIPAQTTMMFFIIPLMVFFAVPYQMAFIGILLSLPLLRSLLNVSVQNHNYGE